MARKVRRDSKIARRRVYARKHRRHTPKMSLIKAIGFIAGSYLGTFAPSGNTEPQSAIELLKSNPQLAAQNLLDSATGFDLQSGGFYLENLQYFWGPTVGGIVVDAVVKKFMPALKHVKVPFLKNVVVA